MEYNFKKPIARIDFLTSSGEVGESVDYTDPKAFLAAVKEENYHGTPMVIVLYRDEKGKTIPQDFRKDLDPQPQGFKIENLAVLFVDGDKLDEINHFLSLESADLDEGEFLDPLGEYEYQGEDNTITITAHFFDGKEIDVKCCGCNEEPSWAEAVLFDHGSEVACTEVFDYFEGWWSLTYEDETYSVLVVRQEENS